MQNMRITDSSKAKQAEDKITQAIVNAAAEPVTRSDGITDASMVVDTNPSQNSSDNQLQNSEVNPKKRRIDERIDDSDVNQQEASKFQAFERSNNDVQMDAALDVVMLTTNKPSTNDRRIMAISKCRNHLDVANC